MYGMTLALVPGLALALLSLHAWWWLLAWAAGGLLLELCVRYPSCASLGEALEGMVDSAADALTGDLGSSDSGGD